MKSKSLTTVSPLLVAPLTRPPAHPWFFSRILSADGIFLVYQPPQDERWRPAMGRRGFFLPGTLLLIMPIKA